MEARYRKNRFSPVCRFFHHGKLFSGWFSYNRRYRFDRRCQFKKWSYDWDDYIKTLHKRSLMPAAIGATAIAWIARVLSGRLVADRGNRSDSGDYMRTSLSSVRDDSSDRDDYLETGL